MSDFADHLRVPGGSHVNIRSYLDRISYRVPAEPSDAGLLCELHRAHMYSVPFENLDIGLGRTIVCDEACFLQKIVGERRGGFCYEINGAFAALLRALGFDVTTLSARVSRADGSEGPEFDHMALLVNLEQPWLADVGFGDSFVEPLRMEIGGEQEQFGRSFRILQDGSRYRYEADLDGAWRPQYSFALQPRDLSEFAGMCHFHQTSPDSHFTQKSICSLATAEGRITLSGDRFIETRTTSREERHVNADERERILRDRFGITLPARKPTESANP